MKLYWVLIFLPLFVFSYEPEMKNVEFELRDSVYKEEYFRFKKMYFSKFPDSSESKKKYFSQILQKFRKNTDNYNLDVAWMDLKFSWITVHLMKEYQPKSPQVDAQLLLFKENLLKKFPKEKKLIDMEFARYKQLSNDMFTISIHLMVKFL